MATQSISSSKWSGSCQLLIEEKIGMKLGSYWYNGDMINNWVPPHGGILRLVYYSSGTTQWMDSAHYYITGISEPNPNPTFRLYPNPATDELTITTENEAPADVAIYDMLGNCVLSHKNVSHNLVDIDVSLIPPGYYLLKLTDQHGLSSSKGFIITR